MMSEDIFPGVIRGSQPPQPYERTLGLAGIEKLGALIRWMSFVPGDTSLTSLVTKALAGDSPCSTATIFVFSPTAKQPFQNIIPQMLQSDYPCSYQNDLLLFLKDG
jgi:hypothetical protein